ncbi:MAG TPA: M81 family metallopeptidase [Stellaceae bacterium]|nr:M81 family metallopeptidase [Stellaceae bacterium]
MPQSPRIALLGFSIECNKFAPPATEADFSARAYAAGEELLAETRTAHPRISQEMPAFVAAMDRTGPWTPVPLRLAQAQPNGPVVHDFFERLMAEWRRGLEASRPLDGVYICSHGAGLTTADDDPDGALLALAREVVGPAVPIVATFDLHANVSERMVDSTDVFIGYRTNPHLDMRERGEEAALAMRELLQGLKPKHAFIRLPIVPPTVTLLTAAGPYAEMIAFGQHRSSRMTPEILNVSVMGGFAYGDTAKNGIAVIVTARRDGREAQALAREIAELGWANRDRFRARLTSLNEAVMRAVEVGMDRAKPALCLADVADNPGGGGRGNTTYLLEALSDAGAEGVLLGIFNDAALAEEAHRLGRGAKFLARMNRAETNRFSKPLAREAEVLALSDGECVGRRGIAAGRKISLGNSAALRIGGITLIVISNRQQCADPIFFEMFGLDIAKARTVVVKSRGHFRGGFDEFFKNEQIVEVDCPGLTSPMLNRFEWTRLPRPVVPLDEDVSWTPPAT